MNREIVAGCVAVVNTYISGAFQAGTLTVCPESASRVDARQIVISSAGRPRTVKTTVAQLGGFAGFGMA